MFARWAVCLAALALAPVAVGAQSAANSGQIVGQIVDASGAAIVGAEVTVRSRRHEPDPPDLVGFRRPLRGVPPAARLIYGVSIAGSGFEPPCESRRDARRLGQRDARDERRGRLRRTSRSAAAAGIERTGTQGKAVLTELQLQNLPASGRRVRSLFLLTPATQIEPECGGFAISGQKGLFTNINVDGGDYTNTHWCGHVEFSPTFSIEALQEFQVLRSTFSAEFGRSTGGIINLSTKSGSERCCAGPASTCSATMRYARRPVRPAVDRRRPAVRRIALAGRSRRTARSS